jgi:hypothetical protein
MDYGKWNNKLHSSKSVFNIECINKSTLQEKSNSKISQRNILLKHITQKSSWKCWLSEQPQVMVQQNTSLNTGFHKSICVPTTYLCGLPTAAFVLTLIRLLWNPLKFTVLSNCSNERGNVAEKCGLGIQYKWCHSSQWCKELFCFQMEVKLLKQARYGGNVIWAVRNLVLNMTFQKHRHSNITV